MKNLIVKMYGEPDIEVREVIPGDTQEQIKEKQKKPFIAKNSCVLKIKYKEEKEFYIFNESDYCYDGATIPFKIGKGNMKLLIPALWHDIICENKGLVNYDRHLSSLIFRELLLQCKVNRTSAQIMYLLVDNFQKFMRGWKKQK